MESLEFFIYIILPVTCAWGRLSLSGIFPEGLGRPVRRADNLTTFMCRLSWNLGSWTSWNPHGLSILVKGTALFLPLPHKWNHQTVCQIFYLQYSCFEYWFYLLHFTDITCPCTCYHYIKSSILSCICQCFCTSHTSIFRRVRKIAKSDW
jgi:hypothetical protein